MMILMLGQSRVFFAMSRDRLLPAAFARVNPRFGTPVRTSVMTGVVVAVISTFVPLTELAELVNIGTLFAFVLVAIGVIVLRRTRPDLERAFRCPGVPVVPILAVLAVDLPDAQPARPPPGCGSWCGWRSVWSSTSCTALAAAGWSPTPTTPVRPTARTGRSAREQQAHDAVSVSWSSARRWWWILVRVLDTCICVTPSSSAIAFCVHSCT